MRSLIGATLVVLALGLAGWVGAQSAPVVIGPTLELPAERASPVPLEENDDILSFFGGEYQADGFFWCIDRSASLGWGGTIDTLKQECRSAIEQLSSDAEFGLVRFSSVATAWSPVARKATDAAKVDATSWVDGMTAAGGRCYSTGMTETLRIANRASRGRRVVILVGGGTPSCGAETPASVVTRIGIENRNSIPIHVIQIGTSGGAAASTGLMQQIAVQNGGTFSLIN